MKHLDIEKKQVENGKRKWCDRYGCEMVFKRVFNITDGERSGENEDRTEE